MTDLTIIKALITDLTVIRTFMIVKSVILLTIALHCAKMTVTIGMNHFVTVITVI